ncbi:MAG TPA: A/G-specific adenine glycosylase [Solirubrobacteraceae bacterium]|nr:A/G-specific adenine glycosylase [Solirubrobacteraceae bacterium]
MLQQTQVARVVPRYLAWMKRWPTASALAAADRADVLREWIGLGYNARAVRLHGACVVVAGEGWPSDLSSLPGVGPYTAAAVGLFAFGRPVLPVDVNVRRVLERSGFAVGRVTSDLGQALMELGATVCTARRPRCGACPLARECPGPAPVAAARRQGRFEGSNRWVRGRVVAALAGVEPWPDIERERVWTAVDGLVRDGLVVRAADGSLRLP